MTDTENTPSGGDGEALSLEAMIDQTMSQAFDAAQGVEEAPSDQNNSGPTRDASGRFVSQAQNNEGAAEVGDQENLSDQGEGAEEAGSEMAPTTRAPASWSQAAKAAFDAADPAIQQEVLKREADMQKFMQSNAEERKQFAGLQQILKPRAEMLAEEHGSVEDGISDLFRISDFAAERPEDFIQWFAQQRQIDLAKLVTGQPGQPSQGQHDPIINGLLQQVQAISRHLSAAQHQEELNAQAAADRQINDFQKDRPHFEAVRVQMGKLIEAGLAEGLEDAYDMAVHANPAIRKQLQEANAAQVAKEVAEKAARARRAAGTNVRASGAPTAVKQGPRTIEQTMSEAFDRAQGA